MRAKILAVDDEHDFELLLTQRFRRQVREGEFIFRFAYHGEEALASAVRAVVRLPRVRLLVLAGSIMGGDISRAVEEVRAKGLLVMSLNMAGSVPDVADLVVSDPVQAGVMAVMAVADTAKFDLMRAKKRRY